MVVGVGDGVASNSNCSSPTIFAVFPLPPAVSSLHLQSDHKLSATVADALSLTMLGTSIASLGEGEEERTESFSSGTYTLVLFHG